MRIAISILLTFFLLGCNSPDYEGFKRVHDSVHFQRITLGDDTRKVDEDSFVSLTIAVSSIDDSLMLEKRVKRVQFGSAEWPKDIKSLIATSNEGEELTIIGSVKDLQVKDWFSPVDVGMDNSLLKLNLFINEVAEASVLLQVRAEERLWSDFEMQGQLSFQNALDSLHFDESDLHEGIYFRSQSDGEGSSIKSGGTALIHYRTYLANGLLIDDTYKDEPFEYHVGKPDQVLKGFAQAIAMMKEGGKAQFLIPYKLAYGDKGSSSGIVPPFSAIIYEAELMKVLN